MELYTPEGRTWIQLAAAGPGGGPLVTVRSAGDLHLEAPEGTVRVHAKHVEHHVTGDQRAEVAGAYTAHVAGAVTVESGAGLGVAGGGGVALVAGGALGLHAGGGHATTGAPVQIEGGGGPRVEAPRVTPRATAWARTPVPATGLLTHTGGRPQIKPKVGAGSVERVKRVEKPASQEIVGVGPKPHPPTVARPCNAQGLADRTHAMSFAMQMQQLRDEWPKLDPTAQRAQFERALNEQLVHAGVPPVKVVPAPIGGSTVGVLDPLSWQINVSDARFTTKPMTDADAEELAKTGYHEARYAEQWFTMARRRAALGEKPNEFGATMGIPASVAIAASKNPLAVAPPDIGPQGAMSPGTPTAVASGSTPTVPAEDATRACAVAWDRSVYGVDAVVRQQTLDDVRTNAPKALARATNDAYTVMRRSGQDSGEYAQARQEYEAADRAYREAQRRYLALPEEADAWATEAEVGGEWQAAAALRRVLPLLP